MSEQKRIKLKIQSIDPTKWWGDDFDVRFFLISQLKEIRNKMILDIGGGIGIICSEMDKSNFRVNLDRSFNDLRICITKVDPEIQNVCASMVHLPFKKNVFQNVICSNVLEIAKSIDFNSKSNEDSDKNFVYPTIDNTLQESKRVLDENGTLFITTPNNAYYNSNKLTFEDLKNITKKIFSYVEISFYNTYPKLSRTNRKLNMAIMLPKIRSKFSNIDGVIKGLNHKQTKNNYSVSFFLKAKYK